MKYLMIVAALLMLTGCERETDRQTSAWFTDYGQRNMDVAGEVCKNGVVYYVTYYDRSVSFAPAFNKDSTVKTCN